MELLLRICRRHRSSMPSYLQVAQDELELVEGIIGKLSQAAR